MPSRGLLRDYEPLDETFWSTSSLVYLVGAGPGKALPVPHALRVGQPAAAPDDPLLTLHNLNQSQFSIIQYFKLTNHSLVFMI